MQYTIAAAPNKFMPKIEQETTIPNQWIDMYSRWSHMGEFVRAVNFGENIFETVTGNECTGRILPDLTRQLFGRSRKPVVFADIGASVHPSIRPSAELLRRVNPGAVLHAQLLDPTYTLPFVRHMVYAKMDCDQPYADPQLSELEQCTDNCVWEIPLPIAHTQLIADGIPNGLHAIEPSEIVTATHMLNYIDRGDISGIFTRATCLVCIVDGIDRGFPYHDIDLHPNRFRSFDEITAIAEGQGFHQLYADSLDGTPNIRGFIFIRD